MPKTFINVILPLAIPKSYSYEVPEDMISKVAIGIRVEVPLKQKLYAGIVERIFTAEKLEYKTKPIISILDESPIVTMNQLDLWRWIAQYYCCGLGEVMNVAMPAGLKLESETKVIYNGNDINEIEDLSDDEYLVAEAVCIQNELTIKQIQDILNKKTIFLVLRSLLDRRIVIIKEELIEKFKPKMVSYMKLHDDYMDDLNKLSFAFDLVANTEKQTKTLLAFVQLSRNKNFSLPVAQVCDLAGTDSSVVKAMEKKNIFVIEKKVMSRLKNVPDPDQEQQEYALNDNQLSAVEEIRKGFENKKPCLLYGVTGSGKTQVYAEIIKQKLEEQKQVLYLLPEISLTTQMVDRLKQIFGEQILVYHSKMSNNERVESWNAVLMGTKLIIGARSALFLPFTNLGLIIVDEEHDTSYKQNDPSPRYNARDASLYMHQTVGCDVILGSATPSLESYTNVMTEKYHLVRMNERYGKSQLPIIEVVDLKPEWKDKRFDGTFSKQLLDGIEDCLINQKQVLLFQNRRGYAPSLSCYECGWKAECTNCDIQMTKHKNFGELKCHYCGSRSTIPTECPACGSADLTEIGYGTERIEEIIAEKFPTAKVGRMDFDTAKTKLALEKVIYSFEVGDIDILVGTQMVTKGLDFGNIGLVGVINADGLLRFPDFRASERAFQLLTQVAGRSGRREEQGKVIIQTYSPQHPIIMETLRQQQTEFYERELKERKMFLYPPFYRLIQITLYHKNATTVHHAATVYADLLKKSLGSRLIGPSVPGIERIRGQYQRTILIKMEKNKDVIKKVKSLIIENKNLLSTIPNCKSVRIQLDVDPY